MIDFPFKVGDKITHTPTSRHTYWQITAIGEFYFLAKTFSPHQAIYEEQLRKDERWERYVEPVVFPEMWIAVLPERSAQIDFADASAAEKRVLGVIHLRPDGSLEMLDRYGKPA